MAKSQETIFISGNPNLFPLEYYDNSEKCYKGVIPDLLEEFSLNSDYKIEYLDHKSEDKRQADFVNGQADIISGIYFDDEIGNGSGEYLHIMKSTIDNKEYSFDILLTDKASYKFKNELKAFMSNAFNENKTIALIGDNRMDIGKGNRMMKTYLVVNAIFLLIIFAFILSYLIKKIRKLNADKYKDASTGVFNYNYLLQEYSNLITEKTRVMYHAVLIDIDTEIIYRTATRKDVVDYVSFVANVLVNYSDENEIVAKLSDDKLLVLKNFANDENMYSWIEEVMNLIRDYSTSRKKSFPSMAWAGLYELKRSDDDITIIIQNARYSSAYAKENNVIFAKCNEEIYNIYYEKARLEDRIKTALVNNEFVPYLSIIKSALTDSIEGVEVVSRWQHPYRGLLKPDKYIDIMEENNQISNLDFKMLDCALKILEKVYKGRDDVPMEFFVTCNFSRITINSGNFVERFLNILEKYKFPREALFVEVNAVRNSNFVFNDNNINIIKRTGVRFIRDDFGTDNVELSKLQFEQYDGVKFDENLIKQINDQCGKVIVRSSVSMCHEMNKVVFAEGVEDKDTLDKITEMEVDYVQGPYIYYSVPENVCFDILRDKNVFSD